MTANTSLPGVLLKGVAASRPAANAVASGTLYSATDTGAITQSDGVSTWSTFASAGGFSNPMTTAEDIIYGGASGAPTRKAKGSDGTFLGVAGGALGYAAVTDALLSTSNITTNNVTTSKHGFAPILPNDATKYLDGTGAYTVPAGGGGGSDLVQTYSGGGSVYIPGMRGSPDAMPASPNAADDEFNALSGYTTLGTLDTSNVSDFPSHLHIKRTLGAVGIDGIYKTAPSMPFTVTAKLAASNIPNFSAGTGSGANYNHAGILLTEASPGKCTSFGFVMNTNTFYASIYRWTNRAALATNIDTSLQAASYYAMPWAYLRIVVASSTDISTFISRDGFLWWPVTSQQNVTSGLTVANVGLAIGDAAAAGTVEAVWDWIRFT